MDAAIRWSLRRMIAASMGLTPDPRAPGTRGSPAAGRDGACRYRSTGETPGTGIRGTLRVPARRADGRRSEEHTSELQSPCNLVCRLLLEKKKKNLTCRLYEIRSLDSRLCWLSRV